MADSMDKLIVIGFFVVFVIVMGWVIWYAKEREKQRRQMALEMGFEPVNEPVDEVFNLFVIDKRYPNHLKWRPGFQKREGDTTLYLPYFSYYERKDSHTLGEDHLALVSPALHLPDFILWAVDERWKQAGGVGGTLVETIINTILGAATGLERISFPDDPEFDDHFIALGRDENALHRAFNNAVLNELARSGAGSIRGSGSALAVSFTGMTKKGQPYIKEKEEVQSLAEIARRLTDVFNARQAGGPGFYQPAGEAEGELAYERKAPQAGFGAPVTCVRCGATNGAGSTSCAYCGNVFSTPG